MAATAKTALTQLAEGDFNIYQIETALALSCWTEDLDLDEYIALDKIMSPGSKNQVIGFGLALLPKYKKQWYRLGCPNTREQWLNAKYGGKK